MLHLRDLLVRFCLMTLSQSRRGQELHPVSDLAAVRFRRRQATTSIMPNRTAASRAPRTSQIKCVDTAPARRNFTWLSSKQKLPRTHVPQVRAREYRPALPGCQKSLRAFYAPDKPSRITEELGFAQSVIIFATASRPSVNAAGPG